MTILASELKFYRAAVSSDQTSNGGRMSATEIATGVKNNIWPDVPQNERLAGSTKYRKAFLKVASTDNLALIDARIFIETPTPGGDRVLFFAGTQTDTQSAITGAERLYGTGGLDTNASAGATTITVNTEGGSGDGAFANGDLIRISDKATVDAVTGNAEFIRLAASNAVAWNGTKATLTFAAGQSLSNSYVAASTRVASVWEAGTIRGSVDTWVRSTAAGTYDGWNGTGNPPTIVATDGIGSIEQTWTITFTSASAFTCVGDTVGSVGSGNKTASFAPNNADFSRPYFTLPASGWGGTWVAGEMISFKTHPASAALWQKRIIPPGTGSLSGDKVIIGVSGESE
ncbi:MAG: hypothetical protein H7836_12765 [Magnetococcus sp. YQC-3]